MFGCHRVWCASGNAIAIPNIIIPRPHLQKLNPNPRIIIIIRRRSYQSPSCSSNRAVRSPSLVELEYADLNLKDKYAHSQVGHLRIRQHVNPLSSFFSQPVPAPDWKEVFEDCTLPLMVDIGCGSGRFLIWLAKNSTESRNYLGLEIRQKLVQRSQIWVNDLALRNIHFMSANATISFEPLVSTYPGPLTSVSILCPDPHFKKRHHKRRVLQKPLMDSISKNLCTEGQRHLLRTFNPKFDTSPGTWKKLLNSKHLFCKISWKQVFLQSDVLEVAADMRTQFDSLSDEFKHIDVVDHNFACDADGWLLQNPMGIRTEREIHAELEGSKIYRRVYVRGINHDLSS